MSRSRKLFAFALILILSFPVNLIAQSGRGRQPGAPPPQPRPTPKPTVPTTTVLGVPDGGKLMKQDQNTDGVTSRFLLRNGLTVIIRERHSSPLVSVNLTVIAGTVNEPDEMVGMARLVRQMILKGTAKRPAASIDKEIARLGGNLISDVIYDQTSFNLTAPSESYQSVVELLADLIQRPAFSPDELKKAVQLVILQDKRKQDAPQTAAIDKLFAAAFTTSRLKRGGGISESMLTSVTREQAMAFYQNLYHPANTIVTIVGDVFMLQALGQVQLQFGDFKKAAGAPKPAASPSPGQKTAAKTAAPVEPPATATTSQSQPSSNPEEPRPEEPRQDRLRYANSRADIGQTIVNIGYLTRAIKPDKKGLKEMATMQMLAAVLGLGKSSRLWQGLREGHASREKMAVAFETSVAYFALPGAGMLMAQLNVDPDRIDRAEAEYFREVERFRRELISDGELQRARVMLEKRYYDTVSLFEDEAQMLAGHQAQFGDYRSFDSNLSSIRAVTAADIQRAAAEYMSLAGATVSEYESSRAPARTFTPEKFAELIVTFAANAAQPIKPEEVKPSLALKTFTQGSERGLVSEGQNVIVTSVPLPVKDFSVLRGSRAYVREDKSQPRMSVIVVFQGGRLIEDQQSSGMTELMLRVMLKSTITRKAELIALELESYGGEIRIVNEPDFFGYTLDVLSRNAELAVKLLLDVIENSFFDKEELAKERSALLALQLAQRDLADARAVDLLGASLFANHPYGLPRYGLDEVVRGANEEKVEAWHNTTIKKQFPLVVLVGDTDGSALVSRIFSEGLKRNELDKSLKVSLPTSLAPPQEKVETGSHHLTAQAAGFRVMGQSISSPTDLFAAMMLSNITASGKLIEELRDKQALTDVVRAGIEQRIASGVFFARISTLPQNEQKARETLQSEMQRLTAAPPTDDEFEQGRNASIGRYAIALQSHPARALEYARAVILGLKPSDIEAQPDIIRGVKKTDIKRIAESIIKENRGGRGVVRGVAAVSSKN